jgi:hypothetical protein
MPRIVWTHGLTITDDAAARRFKETGWLIPTHIWRALVEVRRTAGPSEDALSVSLSFPTLSSPRR